MAEIRLVFARPMGNDPDFPFVFLQRCGPGSNALSVPSLSSSVTWTAKEVVRLAGQVCLYIVAEKEITAANFEKGAQVSVVYLLRWDIVPYNYTDPT